MNIPKVDLNIKHIKWCHNFMKEQAKSASIARKILKQSRTYNPFDTNRGIDKVLSRYEKSFW